MSWPISSWLDLMLTLPHHAENVLFFGCRGVEQDYHFKDEWQKMVDEGDLTLSVAASRDQVSRRLHSLLYASLIPPRSAQDDKIYVQHRIPEYSAKIWDYLSRGGFVYLCG